MTDPVGFINRASAPGVTKAPFSLDATGHGGHGGPGGPNAAGKPDFANSLLNQINEVNKLQNEANQGAEDFATGKRTDIESVVVGAEKADAAFRMLLALRNKVQAAYDEIKQVRI